MFAYWKTIADKLLFSNNFNVGVTDNDIVKIYIYAYEYTK